MPYKLRKAPKRDAFWVINTETGKKHSNEALPRDRAEAQMRALYASETRGGASAPKGLPISLLQVLARASYSGRTPLRAGGFELVRSSPTIKIYRRGDGIVVSVRGTDPTDKNDLVADFASVKGTLRETTRYKQDEAFLRKFQEDFPRSKFRYTAVGHSLGGAIIDGFFRDKLIDNAFSFNPMIEPHERGGNPLHRRLYNNEDPLYLAFGKGVRGVEVRDPRDPLWLAWAKFKLPKGLRELFALYDAHRLQKFKGGGVGVENAITSLYPPNAVERRTIREVVGEEDEMEERDVLVDVPRAEQKVESVPVNAIMINPDHDERNPVKGVRKFLFSEDGPVLIDPKKPEGSANYRRSKRLFPVKRIERREVPTGRKIPVEEERERDVPLKKEFAEELENMEKDLRTLSHFYGNRDPAMALGFRVVADGIFDVLRSKYGVIDRRPKHIRDQQNRRHEEAQGYSTKGVMGQNPNRLFESPNPEERLRDEVEPFFAMTLGTMTDPDNPMYGAPPKAGTYDIPPRTQKEMEFLLQDFPNIKGDTMYTAKNTVRAIPPNRAYIRV